MIGTSLSQYRIIAKLGAGGMGEVYLADDTALGRQVAIKFLPSDSVASADALERFKREARAAAALNHPNIITIYGAGVHEKHPYIVMEHVAGESLSRAIERKDLPVERALEIAIQIFEGLAAAHEAGVVHRDIKPDNILIDGTGRIRILDFGLAKLRGSTAVTAADSTVGTIDYMSPEQARSAAVDERSDLFSAGIVLYEMVAGRRPFVGEHRASVLYAIIHNDPQPLRRYNNTASDEIQRIVGNLLAKDSDERYPSAKAVLVELRRERGSSSVVARRPRSKLWIGGALGVTLVAAGVWLASLRNTPRPGLNEINSIAVLPFVNMSDDASQEYFSDGLSEELINVLTKVPDLKVSGRTSSFSFKGKNEDLRTIGEKLGVAHILEGSLRKSGNRIRITAQLVKAADGFHLWSETYDRTLDDVFAVQDDIAQSVAKELRVTLVPSEANEPRPDAEAHDLVLQAQFLFQTRSVENTRRARILIERALALAPDDASAWAEMGQVRLTEAREAATAEKTQELTELGRQALTKALALDPDLAVAHARLAVVNENSWEFAEAERSVERALELDPKNPIVLTTAAVLNALLGRVDEAIAFERKRIEIDPLALSSFSNLAAFYIQAGRLDEAEATAQEVLGLSRDHTDAYESLGLIQLLRGEVDKARVSYARYVELLGDESDRLFVVAIVEHSAGNAAASASAIAELETKFTDDPYTCAQVRAWSGDIDLAFAWFEKAVALREPYLNRIKGDPYLRNLHTDSRWNTLLKKISLPTD